jgi:hypothetical protein
MYILVKSKITPSNTVDNVFNSASDAEINEMAQQNAAVEQSQ